MFAASADSLAGGAWPLVLVAAFAAMLAGGYVRTRPSARMGGLALAACGPALLIGALPQPTSGGAVLFTLALVFGAASPALAATLTLTYPSRTRPWAAWPALGATVVWLGLLGALAFDPQTTGCFDCDRNLLGVFAAGHDAIVASGLAASAITCAAAALLGLVAWRRVPAAMAAGLGAAWLAVEASYGAPAVTPTTRALWLAHVGAVALTAAVIGVEFARARRLRGRVAGLVASALPSADALRAAFGDPALEIVFPHGAAWIDADGQTVGSSRTRAVTEVARDGELIALLRHDAPGERIAAAARGAGLALEHASLRARLHAEVAELAASRQRIVAIGDAERRRLERDLHDGAQQQLIALSMTLDGEAREQVKTALAELRSLAHGIHPAALADAGLEAALLELADDAGVPLRTERLPAARLPAAVESALYRLVLDAVACAERAGDGGAVRVTVDVGAARVTLPGVAAPAAARALQHAADRFAALGGELRVTASDGGAVALGSLSCGS